MVFLELLLEILVWPLALVVCFVGAAAGYYFGGGAGGAMGAFIGLVVGFCFDVGVDSAKAKHAVAFAFGTLCAVLTLVALAYVIAPDK